MKKIFTLIIFAALCGAAQSQSYTLTTTNVAYTDLTGATASAGDWKNPRAISLGFNFRFFSNTYSTAYVVPYLGLVNFTNAAKYDEISIIGAALVKHTSLTTSSFSYKIEGSAPNRIAKFQWKNGGFEYDTEGTAFFNAQIWLYEGSNIIEIRHGSSTITQSVFAHNSPMYHIQNEDQDSIYYVTGTAASPTLELNSTQPSGIGSYPGQGTMYKYTPKGGSTNPGPGAAINEIKGSNNVTVYPNPTQGEITIEGKEPIGHICITDMQGKTVAQYDLQGTGATINSGLPAGFYFIQVNSGGSLITKKLQVF